VSSRRRPGESALVTREQIVDAADALARADGLDKLSVRRVSAALSVTPAALYWHLANKQQLVSEIVDRIFGRVERPDPSCGTWLDQFLLYYSSTRGEFVQYPGISAALMTHEPTEATLLSCLYPFQRLTEGGFDEDAAVAVFRAASTFMTGHLMMIDLSRHRSRRERGEVFVPTAPRHRKLLAERPEYFGFVRSLVEFDDAYSRDQFLLGLELLVRGAGAEYGVPVPTREEVPA
jgi:AcrR family transcriptional regulator